jgi:hypothetical protein
MSARCATRWIGFAAASTVSVALLVGCSAVDNAGIAPEDRPRPTSEPSVDPTPVPTFVAGGTAADNLAVFTAVGKRAIEQDGGATAQALVDGLVGVGFISSELEVTGDTTAAGFDADSVFVAARFGAECLIGQARPDAFTAMVLPALSNDRCLVGLADRIG